MSVDGAVSVVFRIGTSIVAGCTFATTILRMVLIECLDLGFRLYPNVTFYVYVDDIDLGAYGEEDEVVDAVAGATRFLVLAIENSVQAVVSRGKSVVLGSSAGVRDRLQDKLAPRGIGICTRGKNLVWILTSPEGAGAPP